MRLTKIKLSNVFSFKEASITVDRRVTSIIGGNDSGKTNLLRCLHKIFNPENSLDILEEMRCQFSEGMPHVLMSFSFNEKEIDRLKQLLNSRSEFLSRSIKLTCSPSEATISWGDQSKQKKVLNKEDFQHIQRTFIQTIMFETTITPVRGSIEASELIKRPESAEGRLLKLGGLKPEDLTELVRGHNKGLVALGQCGEKLTKYFSSEWTQSNEIQIHLRPVFDSTHGLIIEFMVSDELGATVPLISRGDGLRWFLSFFTELRSMNLRKEVMSTLFLFDEPGIHLHPAAQSDLCRLFNEDLVTSENRQVLYTTHSPFMLDWSRSHQVRVLERTRSGTLIVDKPYHSTKSLNFWEPFRRNIGLFLGDLGLLGDKNLLVEGVTDQIILSFLSLEAKVQGQRHLNIGERRVIPFGNHRALELLVATSLAYGREVVVLVDSDNSGKQAIKILQTAGFQQVVVLSISEFLLEAFPNRDTSIEDIFDHEWYLEQVNRFYKEFSWYDSSISLKDISSDISIAKALTEYFVSKKWQDGQTHEFNKAGIAVHIASVEPSIDWAKMPISFTGLCERVENPVGLLQWGNCNETAGTGMDHADWATILSLTLGSNQGVKKLKFSTKKDNSSNLEPFVEYPSDDGTKDVIIWDNWEKKVVSEVPFLKQGSARILLAGNHLLMRVEYIHVQVIYANDRTIEFECPFSRGELGDPWERFAQKYKPGDIVEGVVSELSHITPAGFYVVFDGYDGVLGFVHISQISDTVWIKDVGDVVKEGEKVTTKIIELEPALKMLKLTRMGV